MGFTDGYKTYDTSNGFGNRRKWINAFEERMNFRVNTDQETKEKESVYASLYECKTLGELRKEYYRLMNIHHPDKAGDTEENKIIAQAINDTYFKLKSKL